MRWSDFDPTQPNPAAGGLKGILIYAGNCKGCVGSRRLGDSYFTSKRRNESASAAIFTRKVGHTQRGGRPILFDRFYGAQLGGHAVDLLLAKLGASKMLAMSSRRPHKQSASWRIGDLADSSGEFGRSRPSDLAKGRRIHH